jgi:hypothetical protein
MNRVSMHYRLFLSLMVVMVGFCHSSYAVTLVYNLKVRRVFTIAPLLERMKRKWLVTAVPIIFSRKSHIVEEPTHLDVHEKRITSGSLCNVRYVLSKHWWVEATTGIEVDHGSYKGSNPLHAYKVGLDDIVFTGGYRHFFREKWQLVGYGLVGIPVRRCVDLDDRFGPFVGSRFYNIGIGLEGSYSFMSQLKRSCAAIVQYRLIHGFNRRWFPILPNDAKIQPGNITDILCTLQYRERRTIVEAGYNLTFYSNQALLLATEKIKSDTFLRHSGYATISHALLEGPFGKSLVFGAGFNISHSQKFDARTITGWLYGTIVF